MESFRLFGLIKFVRPNIWKTTYCIYVETGYGITHNRNLTCILDFKSSPLLTGKNKKTNYVFHQVEFVDKNNLEAQNPRRDTSIPSVSAGLSGEGGAEVLLYTYGNNQLGLLVFRCRSMKPNCSI